MILEADLENPDHRKSILELINAYSRDPMGGGVVLSEDVQKRIIAGLRQYPMTRVFLAYQGKEAVGTAVCFLGFSTFGAGPVINIHDISVKPEHRNKGIGRRLLERVEEKARELGCCKLTLEVREDNPARRLYKKFGFDNPTFGDTGVPTLFLDKKL